MDKLEQTVTKLFNVIGKALTVAEPKVNDKLDALDKWLDKHDKTKKTS